MAVSAICSVPVPPCPNRMMGPNTGSVAAPTISSQACGRRDHSLNRESLQRRLRAQCAHALQHFRRHFDQHVGCLNVECDASDVGFVRNVRRKNFQDDRKAELPRPRSFAASISRAMRVSTTGIPYARRIALALRLAEQRPVFAQRHCPRSIARLPVSGVKVSSTAGGVSNSISWLRRYCTPCRKAVAACSGVS